MNVAVIGASKKPERYSYRAIKLLGEKGHNVFPVHPALRNVDGVKVYRSLNDIKDYIDTITFYVSAQNSDRITDDILRTVPRRAIFNPGAENASLAEKLKRINIEVLEACTLVLLKTNQF